MEMLSIIGFEITKSRGAQTHRLFQYRIEHRGEIAGRGIDDAQHLGDRRLLRKKLVTVGPCVSKLALKGGVSLLKIGCRAVGRRAHVRPRAAIVPVQSYADRRSRHRLLKRVPLPETSREQIARGHETRESASWRTAWFPVVCGNGCKRRFSPVAPRPPEGLAERRTVAPPGRGNGSCCGIEHLDDTLYRL